MKKKRLWGLVPIVSFWPLYAIGYEFITSHPFADWYGMPLFVTLILLWLYSVQIAIDNS